MLLLLASIVFPMDTLDMIYDNFYQNQKASITLITDKDYYLPGEDVMYLASINNLTTNLNTANLKWGNVVLFDQNKYILDYTRVFIEENKAFNSVHIPDSLSTSHIYLGISTPATGFCVEKLSVINPTNNSEVKPEIKVLTKNPLLYPDKVNSIKIVASFYSGEKISILTENGFLVEEAILDQKRMIDFIPQADKKYFVEIGADRIELPDVKKYILIDASIKSSLLNVSIKNIPANSNGEILMICAGKELLWLSKLKAKEPTIDVSIDDNKSEYIICFILNSRLQVLDKKFIKRNQPREKLIGEVRNDTLFFDLPEKHLKSSFLSTALHSNWKDHRFRFNPEEIKELTQFGEISNLMSFRDSNEKLNWLNYNFEIDLTQLLTKEKPNTPVSLDKIAYNLPASIKIDDRLMINAIDNRGRIIDHKLKDHQILINTNHFDNQKDILIIGATYKNNKIKLEKDTISELEQYSKLIDDYFLNTNAANHNFINNSTYNTNFGPQYEQTTILNEVIVADNKKNPYIAGGKGKLVSKEELNIGEYKTALELLTQIGYNDPNLATGRLFSKKRYRDVPRQWRYPPSIAYPVFLVINGPKISHYRGYDFRRLQEIDVEQVESIVKIVDQQPEMVIVNVNFKSEKTYIQYDQVFSRPNYNENMGVLSWDYVKSGNQTMVVKIPINHGKKEINWSLQFFDSTGTIFTYSGALVNEE